MSDKKVNIKKEEVVTVKYPLRGHRLNETLSVRAERV
jgi:hypothetical protein